MSNRLLYKSVAGPDLANSVSNYLQANKALASGFTGLGDVAATLDKNRADAANAALLRGLIKQESFADAQNYLNAAGTQQDLAYATAAYLDKAMNYKQGMPEVDKQVFNNRINTEYAQNGDLVSKAFQAYSRGDVASYNAQLEEARRRGLSSQVIDKIKYEVETNRGRRIINDQNQYNLNEQIRYDQILRQAEPIMNEYRRLVRNRDENLAKNLLRENAHILGRLKASDYQNLLGTHTKDLQETADKGFKVDSEFIKAAFLADAGQHKTADAQWDVLQEHLKKTDDPRVQQVLINSWEQTWGKKYADYAPLKIDKNESTTLFNTAKKSSEEKQQIAEEEKIKAEVQRQSYENYQRRMAELAKQYDANQFTEPSQADRAVESMVQRQIPSSDLRFVDTTGLNDNALARVNFGRANNGLEPLPSNFDAYSQTGTASTLLGRLGQEDYYNRWYRNEYPKQEINVDYSPYQIKSTTQGAAEQAAKVLDTNATSVKVGEDINTTIQKNNAGNLKWNTQSKESQQAVVNNIIADSMYIGQVADAKIQQLNKEQANLTKGINTPLGKLAITSTGKITATEAANALYPLLENKDKNNEEINATKEYLAKAIRQIAERANVPIEIAQMALEGSITDTQILQIDNDLSPDMWSKTIGYALTDAVTKAKLYHDSLGSDGLHRYIQIEKEKARIPQAVSAIDTARTQFINDHTLSYSNEDLARKDKLTANTFDVNLAIIFR